jgi:hypothetical protein
MARFAAYLALIISGLAFWVIELLLNYKDYAGNDPFGLEQDYQKAFILNQTQLIIAELLFPFGMVIAFLLLLIFKATLHSVRVALGFLLFVGMEFWMWRAYIFKGRMAILYLQNDAKDPSLILPDTFKEYMVAFAVSFIILLLLREFAIGNDPDVLNEKLQRSLKKRKE